MPIALCHILPARPSCVKKHFPTPAKYPLIFPNHMHLSQVFASYPQFSQSYPQAVVILNAGRHPAILLCLEHEHVNPSSNC